MFWLLNAMLFGAAVGLAQDRAGDSRTMTTRDALTVDVEKPLSADDW